MKLQSRYSLVAMILSVLLLILIGKSAVDLRSDINELNSRHIATLSTMQHMESDVLEGVEEAFAYVILNAEDEKNEFYAKMKDFDDNAIAFQAVAELQDEEVEAEVVVDLAVLSAKANLMDTANNLFEEFERLGLTTSQTVGAFEDAVDSLSEQLDNLVEIEKQELTEHVEGMNQGATRNFAILFFLSAFLSAMLFMGIRSK